MPTTRICTASESSGVAVFWVGYVRTVRKEVREVEKRKAGDLLLDDLVIPFKGPSLPELKQRLSRAIQNGDLPRSEEILKAIHKHFGPSALKPIRPPMREGIR